MTYLITGATGDVGSRVVQQLIQRDIRPRILTRSEEKARELFGNNAEIYTGDLAIPETIRPALRGTDAVFLVTVGPEIPARDEDAAKIAKEEGVGRIIKLSSLDVEHGLAIGAWHEKDETAIRRTGVPFTFVRPSGFMTNFLSWVHAIKTEGIVRSSTAGGRRPFIHPEDIAAVSVEALLNRRYAGQILSLTGPTSLTFCDATQIIAQATGRTLHYRAISDEEAGERYSRVSGSPDETDAHVALWRAIREGRLATTTDEVEQTLRRTPIPMEQWAAENAQHFIS
jgi:uncharacterized protein YbjT (DUF2867 family)